jgi:hypothetical protein
MLLLCDCNLWTSSQRLVSMSLPICLLLLVHFPARLGAAVATPTAQQPAAAHSAILAGRRLAVASGSHGNSWLPLAGLAGKEEVKWVLWTVCWFRARHITVMLLLPLLLASA